MAVRMEYETTAQCSPEKIWERFSDVQSWKRWNPSIGGVRWVAGEPWKQGSRLAMDVVQPRPITLESEVLAVEAPRLLTLKGKAMGVTAEHTFSFEPQPDGTTRMRTWQVLTGAATMFISNQMKKTATDVFAQWFEAMRTEAESC